MKKQFFYAAFAIAMMASCTNENDVLVEQPATPDDDRVAIELGVDAPSITASSKASRGTGSVGDLEGTNNKWNSERLYIAMVDKDGNLATETNAQDETVNILDWTNHEYRAPREGSSELIRIYNHSTYDEETGYGTLQYKYYPVNGKYDFYGWHIDALTIADETTTEGVQVNVAGGAATVNNITIDGTQDIMGARTIPFTDANTAKYDNKWTADLNDWAFSARTARAEVRPILKYEHQLARLKFYVRAGSHKTAQYGENNTENKTADDQSTAMYVTALSVSDLANIIDMNLNDNGAISTTKNAAAIATEFQLGSKDANTGIVTAGILDKVAPKYKYESSNTDTKGELIGESMMFFPCEIATATGTANSTESLKINLSLEQLVIDTETESQNGSTYTYATKTQDASVTVKASSIVGGNDSKKFEPGKSYDIYITIYGFERIEVTAELTAWEDGGDVDVDIEEGESKDPVVTPTTTDVTVNVTGLDEGETADAISVVDAAGAEVQVTEGKYTLTVGATYTVTVTKEGYTQSGETSFTIAEGKTTIEVTMTKNEEPEPDTQDVTFTVTPSVDGEVTLTVDGQVLEAADSKYTVEDGKEVAWTVVVTEGEGEEQTTTTYSGTFTVSSENTEVTLTCDDSAKQQN